MPDEVKEEVVEEVEEEKKKGVFGKVKDAILPDAAPSAPIPSGGLGVSQF